MNVEFYLCFGFRLCILIIEHRERSRERAKMENEIEKGVRDKSSSETREVIRLKYNPFLYSKVQERTTVRLI